MSAIGIFDTGVGGLSIYHSFNTAFPDYKCIYYADSFRHPYGDLRPENIFHYSLQAVDYLSKNGCSIIIFACNTVTCELILNKTNYQMLTIMYPNIRFFNVIEPCSKALSTLTSGCIAIFGTNRTISSNLFLKYVNDLNPSVRIIQEACPIWVSLVEYGFADINMIKCFLEYHLNNVLLNNHVDTIILGCTHFEFLRRQIELLLHGNIVILSQGDMLVEHIKHELYKKPNLFSNIEYGRTKFITTGGVDEFGIKIEKVLSDRYDIENIKHITVKEIEVCNER